ncbi:MAG: putative glycoside hydrolase [Candidatus Bipolaricaulia bacterium]
MGGKRHLIIFFSPLLIGMMGITTPFGFAHPASDAGSAPLIVDFTLFPSRPTDLNLIQFTDRSHHSSRKVVAWHWSFGDGGSSTLQHPRHRYADAGIYRVQLTTVGDGGQSASRSVEITVANVEPNARFTLESAYPKVGELVTLNGMISDDPDGEITNYAWDLDGDGIYERQGAIVSHSWPDEGIYEVTLRVIDEDGATAGRTARVAVVGSEILAARDPDRELIRKPQLRKRVSGRKALYMNSYVLRQPEAVDQLIEQILTTELNAIVINAKNMHGELTYDTQVPLAVEIGARVPRFNLEEVLSKFQAHGIYTIARQVVFYDPILAQYEGVATAPWVLPPNGQVIEYNVQIAEELAKRGFDEVQLDYIRFPDDGRLSSIYQERYDLIGEFLRQLHRRLSRSVNLSVDVFGRTLWDWNTEQIDPIAQHLEEMARYVDVISPMVYPSLFNGKLKSQPYYTVRTVLEKGLERVNVPLRPYLQGFRLEIPSNMSYFDYIERQITAVSDLGIDGYIIWNPRSDYKTVWEVIKRPITVASRADGTGPPEP